MKEVWTVTRKSSDRGPKKLGARQDRSRVRPQPFSRRSTARDGVARWRAELMVTDPSLVDG